LLWGIKINEKFKIKGLPSLTELTHANFMCQFHAMPISWVFPMSIFPIFLIKIFLIKKKMPIAAAPVISHNFSLNKWDG